MIPLLLLLSHVVASSLSVQANVDLCIVVKNKTLICNNVDTIFPNMSYENNYSMVELKCESCNLGTFGPNTFPYTNYLKTMNLTYSGIKMIESYGFSKLKRIRNLDLRWNGIHNICSNAFNGLLDTYEINLDHNELQLLTPGFMNNSKSTSLVIRWNNLTEIPKNSFLGFKRAFSVDLSHNHISTLHTDSLQYLSESQHLRLSYNKICELPLGIFRNSYKLENLNLAENRISKLEYGTLEGLYSLTDLDLAGNRLTELEPEMLLPIRYLRVLNLNNNRISNLDAVKLHSYQIMLRKIHLWGNFWVCKGLNHLVKYYRSQEVDVVPYVKFNVPNVKGIACEPHESLSYFLSIHEKTECND